MARGWLACTADASAIMAAVGEALAVPQQVALALSQSHAQVRGAPPTWTGQQRAERLHLRCPGLPLPVGCRRHAAAHA